MFDLNFLLRVQGAGIRSWIVAPIPAYYGKPYFWLMSQIGSPPPISMLIWGLGTFKSIEFNGEVLQLNVEFGLDLDVLTVFEEERHRRRCRP